MRPLQIGQRTAKNRIVVTAHTYGLNDGTPVGVDAMAAYVLERLHGGVGVLVMGETSVETDTAGWGAARSDDSLLKLYRKVAQGAAETNAIVIEQLFMSGGQVWHEEARQALAPSGVPHTRSYVVPNVFATEQVWDAVELFTAGAARAAEGGLAGVEIKADQGKLVHQFLSSRYNLRDDDWGGPHISSRMTFLEEILKSIRRRFPDLLLGVRLPLMLNPAGFTPTDLSIDDVEYVASAISNAGLVDYVSLSAETNSTALGYLLGHADTATPTKAYRQAAAQVRARSSVPTIYAGSVVRVSEASSILLEGVADLVGMTRATIADPEIVAKTEAGTLDLIRPCIGCNDGCVGNTWYGRPIRCSVNPRTGRESVTPPVTDRRDPFSVAIVGAGPSGMQCALTLAQGGARVTIFDRQARLGGSLHLATRLPGKTQFRDLIDYFERALVQFENVDFRLSESVESLSQIEHEYSSVVLATGARSTIPAQFQGNPTATTDRSILATEDIWTGKSVIVVDGERHRDALSVAAWISDRGAKVEVVTPFDAEGLGLNPVTLTSALRGLKERGVNVTRWSEVVEIQGTRVKLFNQILGETEDRAAIDRVVFVCNSLPITIPGSDNKVLVSIGDARMELGLEAAVLSGDELARGLLRTHE